VSRLLEHRFSLTRQLSAAGAALRAFPPHAGRAGPAGLLWLSPEVRRALSGNAGCFDRPDILALAADRAVPVQRTDLAEWVAGGNGPPEEDLVALAEQLATARDAALLHPPRRGQLSLLIDETRGLSAAAVEVAGQRALAVCGDRRTGAAVVADRGQAEAALFDGARLLRAGSRP
jgi:hypothetical protein